MNKTVTQSENGTIVIRIPMRFRHRFCRKEIIIPPNAAPEDLASSLQIAIARAFYWQKLLDTGEVKSIGELAQKIGMNKSHLAGFLRATLLAPDIIKAIIDGCEPDNLSTARLRDEPIPLLWEEQRQRFPFPQAHAESHPTGTLCDSNETVA